MTSKATVQSDPAPILACTISRDVQRFDLLIDDLEQDLGEAWGDLNFEDALVFLKQPDSTGKPTHKAQWDSKSMEAPPHDPSPRNP